MMIKILKSSFIAGGLLFFQFIALSDWGLAESLRIVTYNIRHGEGVDGMIDLDRTAEVISRLTPDLVALQEVDKNCSRSGNRDLAAILGNQLNMEFRFGAFMDFQGGQYGLAVLSKFPIRKTRRIQLPPGSREPRCALEIEFVLESLGTPISFVSVHNDWIDEDVRVKQVLALDKAFETIRHPVVLAGDFNGERSDRSMQILEEKGWNVIDKQGQKTFPSVNPRVEIDFIVVRGFPELNSENRVVPETKASDHLPVLTILNFLDVYP